LPKWPKNCFEPFGKGGWPPISTWIRYNNILLDSPMIYPRINVFTPSLLES
jgi:hypothetical protein